MENQNLTLNQIHRKFQIRKPFMDWTSDEKTEYLDKLNKGKIAGQLPFEAWVNQKYRMKEKYHNAADGTAAGDIIGKILNKVTGDTTDADEQVTDISTTYSKTILGMKPLVFWSVTTVILFAVGYGIYQYVESNKNSK